MSGTLGQQYGNYLSSILHLDFGTAYSNNQRCCRTFWIAASGP